MLHPDHQDDVATLCRLVQMDPSAYISFELPAMADSTTPTQTGKPLPAGTTFADSARSTEPSVSPEPVSAGTAVTTAPLAPETPPVADSAPPPKTVPAPAGPPHPFAVSLPAAPQPVTGRDLCVLAALHARGVREPSIVTVLSAVGGCGSTTILANLARALSIIGDRVLVTDANGPTTLDYCYQKRGEATGLLLSTQALSPFEGQVHVLRSDANAPGASQSVVIRFHRAVAELQGRIDRILVGTRDVGLPAIGGGTSPCLIVLTPDLRSLLAVPAIQSAFAPLRSDSETAIAPTFLLNRFDANNPLHVDIRYQLAAQLGSQLLPFAMPETDLVGKALAQGLNVLDCAPQSSYAEACFSLVEWCRGVSGKFDSIASQFEETQLV